MSLIVPAPRALEGEVLGKDEEARILFSPSAFQKAGARQLSMPAGGSLADAVALTGVKPRLARHLGVYVGEHRIERRYWDKVRPKPGALIYIRVELSGGDGDKNPLRALLMIAVAVVAVVAGGWVGGLSIFGKTGALAGWGSVASSVTTAAVLTAGAALTNALIPPPKLGPSSFSFDQQPGNPYASLTGIRNQFAPYAPIPRIIGKRRMYPLLAARPYTEAQGKNQFVRMLLLVGYGPLDVSDIRIGNTPISAFAHAQVQVREGWPDDAPITLYTKQIQEEPLSILLNPSTDQTRTSEEGVSELSLDITFWQGLAHINSGNGKRENRTVNFTVQWRPNGTGSWTDAVWINGNSEFGTGSNGQINATAASASTEVRSGRFLVSGGTNYEVKVRRTTAAGGDYDLDAATWTVLRSIKDEPPVNKTGLTLIALRLKATEQLNGGVDTINCIAHSYLEAYDEDTQTWDWELSRSPAWGVTDILRRRGTTAMIPDARIDLPSFNDFAEACAAAAPNADEPRWQCDMVFEGGSVLSAAQLIAATGRGQLSLVDGKYSIVRDVPQDTPVQVITPRNSWGYRGFKAFVEIPHAFRVTFYNADKDYGQDERMVYRDGYSEDGAGDTEVATKFETLDLPACTSSTQAWREGRYHFAQLLLRPEEHSVSMDIEALRCVKGSRVELAHDVISVGLGTGRIQSVELDSAGAAIAIWTDHAVDMEDGVEYGVRIRYRDLSSALHPVATEAGIDQNRLVFDPPLTGEDVPRTGDLCTFGEIAAVTAPMLVKEIRPGPNLTARVVMVDAQDGVHTADTGAIPAFNSYITRGLPIDAIRPPAPTITLRSDGTAIQRASDGTLIDRIAIYHDPPTAGDVVIVNWEAEFKRSGTNEDWVSAGVVRAGTPLFATPVNQGEEYDVRARFISKDGYPSAWTTETEHEVVGKTAAPGPISSLTIFATLNGIKIDFARSPDFDVVRYEVRYGGANWDAATVLDTTCPGPASLYQFPLTGTPVTIRIKAVDVIGLYSTEVTASTPAENARVDGAFFTGNPNLSSVTAYRTPADPLTWTDTAPGARINIAAHTVSTSQANGAAREASYNSGNVAGLNYTTTYHIWAYDPDFDGGAVTYVASLSSLTYVTDARYIWIGSFTTGSSGGGGGGSGTPLCVSADAWLTETLQAKDARPGDLIDVIDEGRLIRAPIERVAHHRTAGVRLIAQCGAELDASVQAPVDQPRGAPIEAGGAEGALVRVHGAGGLRWETIKAVHHLGAIDVVTIQVGDRSFLAGNRPEQRLGTHNKVLGD